MFKVLYAFAFLAVVSGCDGSEAQSPENLVVELMAVWASGETDLLAELMSPDVVYEDIPNGTILRGIDASIGYVTHVHIWASDIEISVDRSFGNESNAVAEWTMTAIQSQPIPGQVPVATNKRITLKGVTLVHVEAGRIVRATDYLDALGFVLQLGSEVVLPGDVIVKLPD